MALESDYLAVEEAVAVAACADIRIFAVTGHCFEVRFVSREIPGVMHALVLVRHHQTDPAAAGKLLSPIGVCGRRLLTLVTMRIAQTSGTGSVSNQANRGKVGTWTVGTGLVRLSTVINHFFQRHVAIGTSRKTTVIVVHVQDLSVGPWSFSSGSSTSTSETSRLRLGGLILSHCTDCQFSVTNS